MNEKLHFEPFNAVHLSDVQRIEELVFSDPWSAHAYEAELVNPIAHYFVGLIGEQVVSYGGYWKVLEEAHITNIAVHPDFQNQGIGTLIVQTLMDHAAEQGVSE